MALEFTSIPDRTGPAVYVFGDGTTQVNQQLMELGNAIDRLTPDETQVAFLDQSHGDGLSVKEFYGLTDFPCVMIVMDDDTVPYQWTLTLPQPDEVSYALSQITGSMEGQINADSARLCNTASSSMSCDSVKSMLNYKC